MHKTRQRRGLASQSIGSPGCGPKLSEYGVVGRLGFVSSIKRQSSAPGAVRMGADPGVLVGKSPGLDSGASRILQTGVSHSAIHISLSAQIVFCGLAIWAKD